MKHYVAVLVTAAALAAGLLISPPLTHGQASEADKAKAAKAAAKAKAIARALEENARQLTLFDRTGKVIKTFGERALYNQPSISPDGKRVAVIRQDLENETADLWVIDIESGAGTKITKSKSREPARSPVWAPDSAWVAFAALRDSYDGIYRAKVDGSGAEELLFKLPGAGAVPTDWSLDGKYINYYVSQLGDNILYELPLDGDHTPVMVARSQSEIVAARLSPDNRFLGYRSNETGRNEIWVRAFDPANPNAAERKWQISDQGGLGMVWWRRDGRELYYFAMDRGIMAVSVSTSPTLEFGKPKLLFKAPNSVPNGPNAAPGNLGSVSRDGERVVFSLPPAPRLEQLTMLDRSGKTVRTIGEPAQIGQPAFSPDGKKLAFVRSNLEAGNANIWTVDLDSGKETQITNDSFPHNNPTWSPDGKHIAYQSNRGTYTSIYWRNSDGAGSEEMLFRYTPGAGLGLTDITPDGKYVLFDGGAILMAAPLTGSDPLARKAVEMSREEYEVGFGRVSPDGRYLSYGSNEVNDRLEIFLRPFNAASAMLGEEGKVQVTKDGPGGGNIWRNDGKELFYVRSDPGSDEIEVKSVELTQAPALRAGEPKLLFKLREAGGGNTKFISPDGQRFVFAIRQPAR
jgi:Tol biopolymer transport system component